MDRRSLFEAATVLAVPIPGRYVVPIIRVTQGVEGLVGSARHNDAEIAMTTQPAFENHYLLRGQDETALRRVFTDRVLHFFRENQGWMVEGDGKRLLLNRLSADEVRTFWRGAVAPSDAGEIGAAVTVLRAGALGDKLKTSPGLPPAEFRSFLSAALDAADQFR